MRCNTRSRSCAAVSDCCAVVGYGTLSIAGVRQNQALHWDGTSWSLVPTPDPDGTGAGAFNSLRDVTCTSATNCYAVGGSTNASSVASTLIEQWNGHAWAVVPSPNPAGGTPILNGISCTSGTSCTAVGRTGIGGTSELTLAMRLSGGHWSITPTPSPG